MQLILPCVDQGSHGIFPEVFFFFLKSYIRRLLGDTYYGIKQLYFDVHICILMPPKQTFDQNFIYIY